MKKAVPKFRTEDAERKFWASHDSTDYIDWRKGKRVTLPNLKLSLIAAGLLIFTLSMDEIAVTFFLIGRDNTLPLEIWGRLRRGITPEINAVSTLIFAVSVALIVIWYRVRARGLGADAQELLERL